MGEEPDPARMPLDSSEFPEEVQVAFFMFSLLSDNWDGMSGSYMGKNWGPCIPLFELYEIEDKKTILFFMKMYEAVLVTYRMEKAEQKRKQDERKSQQGGKTYTHNVRG
jgi:hypothetical protein